MSDFDRCVTFTMQQEGGFTNNPSDPGNWTGREVGVGACRGTNFGISAASYPNLDIVGMTPLIAEGIYHTDFWRPVYGDYLQSGPNLMLFDDAVNAGVEGAIKRFQTVLGVTVDGQIGDETLGAAKAMGAAPLCAKMYVSQVDHYRSLPNFETFGHGWMNRVNARYALAKIMAAGG